MKTLKQLLKQHDESLEALRQYALENLKPGTKIIYQSIQGPTVGEIGSEFKGDVDALRRIVEIGGHQMEFSFTKEGRPL